MEKYHALTVEVAASTHDKKDLDDLLWRTLWNPLGLPRDMRQKFSIQGEELELVAKTDGRVVGGLVAVLMGDAEVELRHLAVSGEFQRQGIGKNLIAGLFAAVVPLGCRRIHTIARSTSVSFFLKTGFKKASGIPPRHPIFEKHGIHFELLEKIFEPAESDEMNKNLT